jgi:hypothetical protein
MGAGCEGGRLTDRSIPQLNYGNDMIYTLSRHIKLKIGVFYCVQIIVWWSKKERKEERKKERKE